VNDNSTAQKKFSKLGYRAFLCRKWSKALTAENFRQLMGSRTYGCSKGRVYSAKQMTDRHCAVKWRYTKTRTVSARGLHYISGGHGVQGESFVRNCEDGLSIM
jgi:hypothetical protein